MGVSTFKTPGALVNQEITRFALSGWAGTSSSGSINASYENLVIYKTAMTQEEVQKNVPEPTTATLSLLALAGLAARRRRK